MPASPYHTPQRSSYPSTITPDLEHHPLLARFFDLRETTAQHLAFRTKQRERDFSPRLLDSIERFLEGVDRTPRAAELLDVLVFDKQQRTRTQSVGRDALQTFRRLHSDGVKLLALENPLSFDSLKKGYRAAALRHHPDRGGSTDTMQVVNDAYATFHALLCRQLEGEEGPAGERAEEQTADAFITSARGLALATHVDLWDMAAARALFDALMDRDAFCIANDRLFQCGANDLRGMMGLLGDLSRRLIAAGLAQDAERVLGVYERLAQAFVEEGRNPDFYERERAKLRSFVSGEKKVRVTLNHPLQVEHAWQQGVIDRAKHKKYIAKFGALDTREEELADRLRRFVTERGFQQLPTDDMPAGPPARSREREEQGERSAAPPAQDPGLVAELWALSAAQRAEYATAFSNTTRLPLVRKYELVRLQSLLYAVITRYEEVSVDRVTEEVALIKRLQPKASRTATAPTCDALAAFLVYLDKLGGEDRMHRLDLLAQLDAETRRVFGEKKGPLFLLGDDVGDEGRIECHHVYFGFARQPLERLVAVLQILAMHMGGGRQDVGRSELNMQ